MVNQRRSARRKYDRASTTDDGLDKNDEERPSSTISDEEDVDTIQIQILDSAQKKFKIPSINPKTCTVQQLKNIGCAIHGVSPPQQRLIYMGKLLNEDTSLLTSYGIKNDLCIIHLFPKPTVVIDRRGGGAEDTSLCAPASSNNDNDDSDTETAHIPQIVLDASEAERHSNVIILSSHEAFEILHRLRLCAFCLLVYSSMELLQDLTLWMGNSFADKGNGCNMFDDSCTEHKPDEPTDTTSPTLSYGEENGPPAWESWNYIQVLISMFSFYVAMLGIKVTTEHELRTARLFWNLLVLLALLWNGCYYWSTVRELQNDIAKRKANPSPDEEYEDDDAGPNIEPPDSMESNLEMESPYSLALYYTSFLLILWLVFLFWARQFKNLMEEAGAEAEERTRSLTNVTSLNSTGYGGAGLQTVDSDPSERGRGTTNESRVTEGASDSNRGGVYDLELQVEGRSIT